jgi:hypothetical protein
VLEVVADERPSLSGLIDYINTNGVSTAFRLTGFNANYASYKPDEQEGMPAW